jgi:hypothetical protein
MSIVAAIKTNLWGQIKLVLLTMRCVFTKSVNARFREHLSVSTYAGFGSVAARHPIKNITDLNDRN